MSERNKSKAQSTGSLARLQLCALEARRALGGGGILALLLAGLALGLRGTAPIPGAGTVEATSAASLARHASWALLASLTFLVLWLRAAKWPGQWQTRDANFLGTRGLGLTGILIATWLGRSAAAAAALLWIAVAAETAARGDAPRDRVLRKLNSPSVALLEGGAQRTWTSTPSELGTHQQASVLLGISTGPGLGPTTEVSFEAQRGEHTTQTRALLYGRHHIQLELPAGSGPIQWRLARLQGGGVPIVDGESFWLMERTNSKFDAPLALWLRAFLCAAAWTAMAMALGSFMRASTALASILALLLWFSHQSALSSIPGAHWFQGLDIVAAGRVPEPLGPLEWTLGAALIAAGNLAAKRGIERQQAP